METSRYSERPNRYLHDAKVIWLGDEFSFRLFSALTYLQTTYNNVLTFK